MVKAVDNRRPEYLSCAGDMWQYSNGAHRARTSSAWPCLFTWATCATGTPFATPLTYTLGLHIFVSNALVPEHDAPRGVRSQHCSAQLHRCMLSRSPETMTGSFCLIKLTPQHSLSMTFSSVATDQYSVLGCQLRTCNAPHSQPVPSVGPSTWLLRPVQLD